MKICMRECSSCKTCQRLCPHSVDPTEDQTHLMYYTCYCLLNQSTNESFDALHTLHTYHQSNAALMINMDGITRPMV